MQTHAKLTMLVARCTHPYFTFRMGLHPEGDRPYLQVRCPEGTCNVTGEPLAWNGRKWDLSYHMTDSEVVQTCFKAAMTALEHEAREQFRFSGQPVMCPHYDVYALVKLCREQKFDEREDNRAA